MTLWEQIEEWRKPCQCYYECSCSGLETAADRLEELIGKPSPPPQPTPVRGVCTVCHEAITPDGTARNPDFHYH